MAPARADAVALTAILALVAVAGWRSATYGIWSHGEPGPGLFPVIVCAMTAVFGLGALVLTLAGAAPTNEEVDPDAAQQEGPILWGRLALYAGAILAWPWLMVPLGYALSAVVVLFVILRFAEGMHWRPLAVTLVSAVVVSWLVFDRLLGVPLPRGPFGIG